MTDFVLQKLSVSNCEQAILHNYYDWGRERAKKTNGLILGVKKPPRSNAGVFLFAGMLYTTVAK